MEHEGDGDANYKWCTRNGLQSLEKGTGRVENRRTCWDHPNYSITKIGQNTEKSSGNLRKCAITDTSERLSVHADVKNFCRADVLQNWGMPTESSVFCDDLTRVSICACPFAPIIKWPCVKSYLVKGQVKTIPLGEKENYKYLGI